MPALDLSVIDQIGRDLHPSHPGMLSEGEVCPWTLFLTMALTLLKGVMPHVPRMLPVLVSDPEARLRAQETFESEDFKKNIEKYFVENIKTDIQAPLNRQILRSSETVMQTVDVMNQLINTFMGSPNNAFSNDDFSGDTNGLDDGTDKPRNFGLMNPNTLSQLFNFGQTLYQMVR
ncbi:uncharacterized protein LOC131887382 [Tigriopus californicus]|uniref:uncharacterized protein LOC131887382 n=1 Tax=Tigriopus californicus TaxID=6832 RepID=UPI0027DA8FB5|nr:uncharacterized protein LOC131887382 [Tigriopus californicus]XP_059091958.1 uncharacterized protein LOC131887382 [Tigriopus californicus]